MKPEETLFAIAESRNITNEMEQFPTGASNIPTKRLHNTAGPKMNWRPTKAELLRNSYTQQKAVYERIIKSPSKDKLMKSAQRLQHRKNMSM